MVALAIIVVLMLFQVATSSILESRATSTELRVLRPRSGDIIIARDYKFTFHIIWTNTTSDTNASILLRQGPTNDLQRIATINGECSLPLPSLRNHRANFSYIQPER